jgi:hypothetical protein
MHQHEDRMVRKSNGTLVLIQKPDRPGGAEVEMSNSLEAVADGFKTSHGQ